MKYIGIRGHKGSGKKSISYLLGNTIEYVLTHNSINDKEYSELFTNWCDELMNTEDVIYSANLTRVYFDNFSDTLFTLLSLMLNIPVDKLHTDYYKDHLVVNIKDFETTVYDTIPSTMKLYTAEEYFKKSSTKVPKSICEDTYMVLREFVMYFGKEVMQRYFGLNVWIKMLNSSKSLFNSIFNDNGSYKIFCDVKTPSEVSYIKNENGIIVKIIRHATRQKIDALVNDIRVDYTITVDSDLYSLKDSILNLANNIIDNK